MTYLPLALPLVVLAWAMFTLPRAQSPGGPDVEPWGEPTSEPWYPTPPEEDDPDWGWDDDDEESSRSMEDSSVTPLRLRVSSTQ